LIECLDRVWIKHIAFAAGSGPLHFLNGGAAYNGVQSPVPGWSDPIEMAIGDFVGEIDLLVLV